MKISGYDIIKKLGEGCSAVVWKAHQVSLDRVVAIKILKEHLCSDPAEVQDFISEARSAAQLKHPNLIQVFDVSKQHSQHYFVMEYIDGPTIRQLLDQRGAISQKNSLKIVRNVAEALKSAWEYANLIHRDIKPDNIMIDSDGTTKLADLGLAKRVDPVRAAQRAADGYVAGTPNYMAPEQAAGSAKLDYRTDMYCLGATLYHMVTGQMPFATDSVADALNKHITGYLPNPRTINSSISPATERLITRLMMKSSTDRHKDWDEVLDDIRNATSDKARATGPAPAGRSTITPLKGRATRVTSAPVATVPLTEKFMPAPAPAPAPAPVAVVQAPRVTQVPASARAVTDRPPPTIVRFIAWTILIAWWSALAWILFSKPEIIRQFLPASDASYLPDTLGPPQDPATQEQTQIEIGPDTEASRTSDTPTNGSNGNANAVAPEPAQNESSDAVLPAALKDRLAGLLTARKFRNALAALEQESKDSRDKTATAEIEKLKAFITEVSGMDDVIKSSFSEKVGEDVVINYKSRQLNVTLNAVSGNNITFSLRVKTADGSESKSVTIPISRLEPLELARWIGPANTAPRCAMKYILLVQGGDSTAARVYAPNCGPFAAAFSERLNKDAPE